VELDVQMTRDSVLVAFHDNTMEANTSCTGLISEYTWAELKDCELENIVFNQHQIVALEAVLNAWAAFEERTIVFDCKVLTNSNKEAFNATFAAKVIELVKAHGGRRDILIEGRSLGFLQLIQAVQPNYKLFINPGNFKEGLEMAKTNGLYGVTIASSNVSSSQIQEAHNHGITVAVWNVSSRKDNVEAINKSPDYIQTDKLKSLVRLLNPDNS